MNHPAPHNDKSRFKGTLRHYHRAGARKHGTWDEWIDGAGARSRSWRKRLKIVGVILAFLALAGIVAGLIIELR
jgi:hypothetical protein